VTFAVNVPFGYWRAHAKSKGRRAEWFAAVHAPVPLVFLVRRAAGATLSYIPLFVAAFFLGQQAGAAAYSAVHARCGSAGRCMPCDLARLLARGGPGCLGRAGPGGHPGVEEHVP